MSVMKTQLQTGSDINCTREEDIYYSVVSDGSSIGSSESKRKEIADFENRNDLKDHNHTQFNTLQLEGATNILSHIDLGLLGLYSTLKDREVNINTA